MSLEGTNDAELLEIVSQFHQGATARFMLATFLCVLDSCTLEAAPSGNGVANDTVMRICVWSELRSS